MFTNPITSIIGLFVALTSVIGSFFPESQATIQSVGTIAVGVGLAVAKDGVGKKAE